jgi:ATP synthase protein I
MADDARERNGGEQPTDDEAALSARLKRLGEQLGHAQPNRSSEADGGHRSRSDSSAIASGFRLSTELVAGVFVGAAIGLLLDRWLGTSPWALLVLLFLGFGAGVLNVMRAAGVGPNDTMAPPDSKQ